MQKQEEADMYTVPEIAFQSYTAELIQKPDKHGSWALRSDRNSIETVVSINVFGTTGNRHSLLVLEKNALSSDFAGKNGRWMLSSKLDNEYCLEFLLEWAVEIKSSGYIVLCGRETPAPFKV
jgi:hypothetical protein